MTAQAPGQAAYEAYNRNDPPQDWEILPWEALAPEEHADWGAAHRAAQKPLRDALAAEAEALEAEAATVNPSRLAEHKRATAGRLRQILEET